MKVSIFCLGCLILSTAACKQNREIKVYKVAKEAAPAPPSPPAPAGDPHAGMPGMTPGAAMPGGASNGDPHAGLSADQLATVRASGSPQVTDTPPAHWKKMPTTSMRQASYLIEGEDGASVDVSLITLRGAAGGNLDNVNRWRGQLGQSPIDEATLKQSAQTLTTPVGPAIAVEIEGLAEGSDAKKDGRMIGVIADKEGDAWFYKMRGNADLTSKEKDNFMKWVISVKPAVPAATQAPVTPDKSDKPGPTHTTRMMTALNRLFGGVASLRLTLFCLAAALVLVFAGTLAQVRLGLYFVQEHYFQSWFVWWAPSSGSFEIPVFPGGHLIGAVLLVNLIASLIWRFSWSWRKLGIQLIHLGLIIMLAGGLATDLFSVSSYMRITEGTSKNYSEDSSRMELAVIDHSDPKLDQVTVVPGELLAAGGTLSHESLPFRIVVKGFYRNSKLIGIDQANSTAVPAATNGVGARYSIRSIPRATKIDERDVMSAVLEIIPAKGGASLGTWLVSDLMAVAQELTLDGRLWSVQLRPARYYKPYSLKLEEFTHEVYPGTQIPKNFSSKVTLADDEHNEHRQVVIYMNHPLRYLGDTYYQSGFEPDNSGTVLQVVRNPGYQAPYIACVIVSIGLLFQFSYQLTGFARRVKPVAVP